MVTLEQIRALAPCYNPSRYSDVPWSGCITEIIENEQVPVTDRLWVALREEFVGQEVLEDFTNFCGGGADAREAATNQIKRAIEGVEPPDRGAIIARIQKAQIEQLLNLLRA